MPLRKINDSQQLQIAVNQILDQLEQFPPGKSWDFRGNRITNAGPSKNDNDYVTRAELNSAIAAIGGISNIAQVQHTYTIQFTPPDGVSDGTISPAFVIGTGRSGIPTLGWLACNQAPTGEDLAINFLYQGNTILKNNLVLSQGTTATVSTSTFIGAITLAQLASVQLQVVTAGAALGISAGLVVRIITQP